MEAPRFIADNNVGKLAKWLRMMGYDTSFFSGEDDSEMVAIAVAESRVILTRDRQIAERRLATSGHLKVYIFDTSEPRKQIQQFIKDHKLKTDFKPFSLCIECNRTLEEKTKKQVEDRVPPYVFKTQQNYMECPACHRIYWRGSHWQAMRHRLKEWLQY